MKVRSAWGIKKYLSKVLSDPKNHSRSTCPTELIRKRVEIKLVKWGFSIRCINPLYFCFLGSCSTFSSFFFDSLKKLVL